MVLYIGGCSYQSSIFILNKQGYILRRLLLYQFSDIDGFFYILDLG